MNKLVKLSTTVLAMFVLVGCGGASGGNSNGEESLPISEEQSQQKMQQLAQSDGYYLEFKYSSSSDGEASEEDHFYYGVKGDVVWMGQDEDGLALKKEGNQYHYYSLEDGNYSFVYSVTNEQAEGLDSAYMSIYTMWLYYGNAFDGQLTKGADTKVAGRSCNTYTFSYSNLGNLSSVMGAGVASLKYEIAVDKELGITMKLSVAGKSSEGSGTFSYEVTKFVTGSSVTVPTLPAAVPASSGEED